MCTIISKIDRQSRFDAWRLHASNMLRAGALGWPWGMGWGGSWEGGSGWGTHVHPWLIHVNVWQKPLKKKEFICSFIYSSVTSWAPMTWRIQTLHLGYTIISTCFGPSLKDVGCLYQILWDLSLSKKNFRSYFSRLWQVNNPNTSFCFSYNELKQQWLFKWQLLNFHNHKIFSHTQLWIWF